MLTRDTGPGPNSPDAPSAGWLRRFVFTTNHTIIGLQYLWLALGSVFLGMIMSLIMRMHLVWPGARIPLLSGFANAPERYVALTILHGSLMVFMVLTAAPQAGFGSYLLPLQIGSGEMAFPRLNALALWATVASFVAITGAFFARIDAGVTLWIGGVAVFCCATLLNSMNFTVTALDLRANGMTLPRLPITVWAWLINAILSLLIFSVLLSACALLLSDRLAGTHFFVMPGFATAGAAALSPAVVAAQWQRLFWFFSQAEVYVAMLPCFGIVTHLLAVFSHKPVWAHRAVVLALCGVGLCGFVVWGQHIFVSAMNPYSPLAFSLLASSLGLPASILLMSWLATLWKGKIELTTSMLFATGFVSLFVTGGISGLFLSRADLAAAAANDNLVTGHFHLVMGVAATFAILAALFFWFPKMFGRRLDERLGKIHFWMTFAGVFCVFMSMHWLGLMARVRGADGSELAGTVLEGAGIGVFVTVATLLTVAAQGVFLGNLVMTLARRKTVAAVPRTLLDNPWNAGTLEWCVDTNLSGVATVHAPVSAGGVFRTADVVVYRGAYEISTLDAEARFMPQNLAPRTTKNLATQTPATDASAAPGQPAAEAL